MSDNNTAKKPSTDPVDAPQPTTSASDFDELAISQEFDANLHAKRHVTAVPLRRPFKHDWIRTHPTWQQISPVLKLAGDRRDELWLVKPALLPGIPADLITRMKFVPYVTRQGAISMWPLRIPSTMGRTDTWAETAIEVAHVARTQWVQVHADQKISAYTFLTLERQEAEPDWGDMAWDALRELAFRAKLIGDFDHPVMLSVQGR